MQNHEVARQLHDDSHARQHLAAASRSCMLQFNGTEVTKSAVVHNKVRSDLRRFLGPLLLILSLGNPAAASDLPGSARATVGLEPAAPAPQTESSAPETTLQTLQDELRRLRAELDSGKSVYPQVSVGGLLQAESAWIRQNDNSISDPLLNDLQDHRGIRRSRLTATGKVAPNVGMMLDLDFSLPGRPTLMDVVAHISDVPFLGTVSIGQFRLPFGLSELTSVKELPLFERPITFAMTPFRQIGVGFSNTTADKRTLLAASVFGSDTDRFGNSFGDSVLVPLSESHRQS